MKTLTQIAAISLSLICSSNIFASDNTDLAKELGQEAIAEIKQDFKQSIPTLDELMAEVKYEKEPDMFNAENETKEANGVNATKIKLVTTVAF